MLIVLGCAIVVGAIPVALVAVFGPSGSWTLVIFGNLLWVAAALTVVFCLAALVRLWVRRPPRASNRR